jgi:flavin-dependent dehydrogenase
MSEYYDVIIVGGGYAGLCCGLKLKGKRVLIVEARKEIARKNRGCQCSLYPIGESFDFEGDDINFQNNKIKVPAGVVARIKRTEVVSGNHKIVATLEDIMPIIDEAIIKGTIENLCREAGVDIITGARVSSVEIDDQRVRVYAGNKKYDANYLLGADGANSMVMRYLPLKRKKIGSLLEMEVEADSMDLPDNGFYAEIKKMMVGIYAQPYYKGYMLGVFQGMGVDGTRIDIKEYLEESLKKLNVKGVTRTYGSSIPIHLSASSSYYKNVIMAGDAVGSFSMITITGAMMAGLLAGEAILKKMEGDSNAFQEYDKKWRKIMKQGSMDGMKYLFPLLKRLNEKRMGRLLGALEGSDLGSVGKGYYLKRIPGIMGAFF